MKTDPLTDLYGRVTALEALVAAMQPDVTELKRAAERLAMLRYHAEDRAGLDVLDRAHMALARFIPEG